MPWPSPDDDWDSEDDWTPPDPPTLEVEVSDPPEVLGMLLGPDGQPVVWLVSRRQIPFGYQAPPK